MKRLVLCTIAALPTLLAVGAAEAAERETWESSWTRTRAGEVLGEEKAKQVRTERAWYLSGEYAPAAKGKARLLTHAQQTTEGEIFKYWREKDVRQGAELRVFRKDDVLRIVGVHMERESQEIPDGSRRALWDSRAWHSAATWTHRLRGPVGQEVVVPWLDVERGATGSARAVREEARRARDAEGAEASFAAWRLEGFPGGTARVYLDDGGRLAGLEQGDAAMLRTGWTWAPEVAEPEIPEVPVPEGPALEPDAPEMPGIPTVEPVPDDGDAPAEDGADDDEGGEAAP